MGLIGNAKSMVVTPLCTPEIKKAPLHPETELRRKSKKGRIARYMDLWYNTGQEKEEVSDEA